MWTNFALILLTFCICMTTARCEILINFEDKDADITQWEEYSDAMMIPEGKSVSSFILQQAQSFTQAVLFTLLYPQQSCGAGITGIMKNVSFDLSNHTLISMRIRNRGEFRGYEFILRHKGKTGRGVPSFVHYFEAPEYFHEISLPLDAFILYQDGVPVENPEPLERSEITTIGILAYAGSKRSERQIGVASLEIRWIKIK